MSQHAITLTGRLTQKPTLSKINEDMYKVSFRVASSRRGLTKDKEWRDFDSAFIDVEAWGQFAINIRTSLEQGMPVIVVGSLCTQEWNDRDTFQKRSRMIIKAHYVGLDLNRYVIASERVAITHNLAGIKMGDTSEQNVIIDQDFTVSHDDEETDDGVALEDQTPEAADAVLDDASLTGADTEAGTDEEKESSVDSAADRFAATQYSDTRERMQAAGAPV